MTSPDDLIERHTAWWRRENEEPLLNVVYREAFPWTWLHGDHARGMALVLDDGTIAVDGPLTPDMIDPERVHAVPFTRGDVFLPVMPFGKIPWMEAICGVTPHVSVASNSIWGGHGRGIWPADWYAEPRKVTVRREWLDCLVALTRHCVDRFAGPFVVAQTAIMRGPMDVLAALIGDRSLVAGMYLHPDETHALLDDLAEICIEVMRAQNAVLPPFRGGHVNVWGIWAPGTVTRHQEDACAYLSPALYTEFIQPVDRKICQAFDYPTIHFHSAHHVHGDAVTDIAELGALQFNLEPPPYGPTLEEWIPLLQRLIRKKPLILQARTLTRAQVDRLLTALPPQGLYLDTHVQEAGEEYFLYRE